MKRERVFTIDYILIYLINILFVTNGIYNSVKHDDYFGTAVLNYTYETNVKNIFLSGITEKKKNGFVLGPGLLKYIFLCCVMTLLRV